MSEQITRRRVLAGGVGAAIGIILEHSEEDDSTMIGGGDEDGGDGDGGNENDGDEDSVTDESEEFYEVEITDAYGTVDGFDVEITNQQFTEA